LATQPFTPNDLNNLLSKPTHANKRTDFLWLVQMFMLKDTTVVGWYGFAGDAVAASYRIPKSMTARDAALDFWAFFSEKFRGEGDKSCPTWMSNLDDPDYR
jgi:hypothetical protein